MHTSARELGEALRIFINEELPAQTTRSLLGVYRSGNGYQVRNYFRKKIPPGHPEIGTAPLNEQLTSVF